MEFGPLSGKGEAILNDRLQDGHVHVVQFSLPPDAQAEETARPSQGGKILQHF